MSDRELLQRLFDMLRQRNFILGDEASVRDMVQRYRQPPVTLHQRVAMQLTVAEYQALAALLSEINQHLKEETVATVQPESAGLAEGEIRESV